MQGIVGKNISRLLTVLLHTVVSTLQLKVWCHRCGFRFSFLKCLACSNCLVLVCFLLHELENSCRSDSPVVACATCTIAHELIDYTVWMNVSVLRD